MGFFSDLGGGINSLFSNLTPNNDAGGLLNAQDALAARQRGQLGLGAGLLSAAGPSPYPISFGQALSGAALQSNAMQNNAIDDALKRKLVASEIMQRMQPPAGELKLVPVMTPQGPRLVPERLAAGMQPFDPNSTKPQDPIGQVEADYRNGLMSKADHDARIKQLTKDTTPKDKGDEPYSPAELKNIQMPGGAPAPLGLTPNMAKLVGAGLAPPENPLDKPMPTTDRERWRMADGSKLPPNIVTQRQAQEAGAQTTTPDEVRADRMATGAAISLDQLEGMALGEPGSPNAPKDAQGRPLPGGGVLRDNHANALMRGIEEKSQDFGKWWGTQESLARDQYEKQRLALATSLAAAESPTGRPQEGATERYLGLIPDQRTPVDEARNMFAVLRARQSALGNPQTGPSITSSGPKFLGFENTQAAPPAQIQRPGVSPLTSLNLFAR
jgi:hypothetical protein